ncbi:helix-turn-helix transcriptional regulator [Ruminococcaceae bacterium OttesenSCG-928-N02]|nr:helix-turn-helix transcriptional regulator [Ruminococcaceae bacterium OttesenSCG-928-N02]
MMQVRQCPVETAVTMIGGKWKIVIIKMLLMGGPLRFGELKRGITGISSKVLTDQLNELMADHLVVKKIYAEVPLHTEYRLTPLGESLQDVLFSLRTWGDEFKRQLAAGELPQFEESAHAG